MRLGFGIRLSSHRPSGPILGPELLTNGDFGSATGWSLLGTGSTISGGTLNTGTASFAGAFQNFGSGTTTGQIYRIVVTVTSLGTGVAPKLDFGPNWSPSGYAGAQVLALGVNTFDITIASGDVNPMKVTLQNYTVGTVQAVIDSISVKKLG